MKILIKDIILFISLSCLSLACGVSSGGPPKLSIDRRQHNWGKVEPGSQVNTLFRLTNEGASPLHVEKVTASCGCTKPVLPTETIEPGSSVPMEVSFVVPADLGSVAHSVTIRTNDPARPELVVYLYAQSWTWLRSSPALVDFGRVSIDTKTIREFQIFSSDSKPFKINAIQSMLKDVVLEVVTPPQSLPMHRFKATYHSNSELGQLLASIFLVTDGPKAPTLNIPCRAEVVGPLVVAPTSLTIDREELGKDLRKTLIINHSGIKEVVISKIELSQPWVLIGSEQRELSSGDMLVDLRIRLQSGEGTTSGHITLTFTSPEGMQLMVPLGVLGLTPPFPSKR